MIHTEKLKIDKNHIFILKFTALLALLFVPIYLRNLGWKIRYHFLTTFSHFSKKKLTPIKHSYNDYSLIGNNDSINSQNAKIGKRRKHSVER